MPKPIAPCLWFDNQAEEAANYYVSVFKNAKITNVDRFSDSGPNLDAGVVYVTDVEAAGSRVRGVLIPDADNVTTSYPIATLDSAPSAAGAAAFVALVLSPEGRAVLAEAGFGSP